MNGIFGTPRIIKFLRYFEVDGGAGLSPPGVEVWGTKGGHLWNIIMYWNRKVVSL